MRVGLGEERQRGRVLGEAAAIREPRVLFLQPAGVGQHQRAQVGRARRAEDRPMKAVGDQSRQQARVIDVRVRQDDGVDRRGMQRETAAQLRRRSSFSP